MLFVVHCVLHKRGLGSWTDGFGVCVEMMHIRDLIQTNSNITGDVEIEGKIHPRTGHVGPEGE
jgi:hypothetical protein